MQLIRKELFSLIGRVTINFYAIFIADIKKFNQVDLNVFNFYKENLLSMLFKLISKIVAC